MVALLLGAPQAGGVLAGPVVEAPLQVVEGEPSRAAAGLEQLVAVVADRDEVGVVGAESQRLEPLAEHGVARAVARGVAQDLCEAQAVEDEARGVDARELGDGGQHVDRVHERPGLGASRGVRAGHEQGHVDATLVQRALGLVRAPGGQDGGALGAVVADEQDVGAGALLVGQRAQEPADLAVHRLDGGRELPAIERVAGEGRARDELGGRRVVRDVRGVVGDVQEPRRLERPELGDGVVGRVDGDVAPAHELDLPVGGLLEARVAALLAVVLRGEDQVPEHPGVVVEALEVGVVEGVLGAVAREVPLADGGGAPRDLAAVEQLGEQDLGQRQLPGGLVELDDAAHAGAAPVAAGQERGPARRAGRGGVGVAEQHALRGQPVQVRGGRGALVLAVRADLVGAEVVGDDDQPAGGRDRSGSRSGGRLGRLARAGDERRDQEHSWPWWW